MMATEAPEVLLERYSGFEECLLTGIRCEGQGVVVHLDFEYVWDASGPDGGRLLEKPRPVTLTLEAVQEFQLQNNLTKAMVAEPDRIDWGLSELARVRVEADPGSPHSRLIVEWEGDLRKIEVLCGTVRAVDR